MDRHNGGHRFGASLLRYLGITRGVAAIWPRKRLLLQLDSSTCSSFMFNGRESLLGGNHFPEFVKIC